MRAPIAAALVLTCAALPGCCAVAGLICPRAPVEGPPRATRDSPEEAVDFVVEAFRRRAPGDVFRSLHPDFVRENGGFSGTDFATGYDLHEADFREDARRLAEAPRRPAVHRADGSAAVDVGDEEVGITLIFVNVPSGRVVLSDDVLPEVRDRLRLPGSGGAPRLSSALAVEGDEVRVRIGAPLGGNGAFVDPRSIRRVEFHDDWLLREVRNARNVRFVDALAERMRAEGSKP